MYYLVSTAGIPNLGDELIAATWLRYLGQVAPDAEVVIDCIDPARVVAPLRDLHPRLRVVSTLWQLCFRHWRLGPRAQEIAASMVADPSRAGDLAGGLELLARAETIHLTGGGFLNDIWPAFVALPAAILATAERSGAITAVTGVGLQPPAPGVTDLLREFTVTDVRDQPSADLLGRPDSYSCDDVFLDAGAWSAPCDAPEIMVSLQATRRPAGLFPPVPPAADEEAASPARRSQEARAAHGTAMLIDLVAKTLAEWDAREVGLIECWPDADRQVRERAAEMAPRVRFYSLGEILRDGFPVAPGQTWLSTRFHPHLLAAAGGARGVAVNLMRGYYDTKHASLITQGSGWDLAHFGPSEPRHQIPAPPQAGGFGHNALAALRARKQAVADRIYG